MVIMQWDLGNAMHGVGFDGLGFGVGYTSYV